jgi:hypothetical protein
MYLNSILLGLLFIYSSFEFVCYKNIILIISIVCGLLKILYAIFRQIYIKMYDKLENDSIITIYINNFGFVI